MVIEGGEMRGKKHEARIPKHENPIPHHSVAKRNPVINKVLDLSIK
jgi:hypothetical protein